MRNPVDRAFSHYRHMRRLGYEPLSFEDAISAEQSRARFSPENVVPWSRFSYVERGKYAAQLLRWMDHYPNTAFLVLKSEDFFANPDAQLQVVLDFLRVPAWSYGEYPNYSYLRPTRADDPISEQLRRQLNAVFGPHNEQLAELLGRELRWE